MKAYLAAALLLLLSCAGRAEGTAELLSPKDYSQLHILLSNPKDPGWADALRRLARSGDGFTLEVLKTLNAEKLAAPQAELLKATLTGIRERVAHEDINTFTQLLQLRLERAAWADLSCNPLEGALVPWTQRFIQQRADQPEVIATLRQIESHYVPTMELTTLFSTMRERVPAYARRILAAAGNSATK